MSITETAIQPETESAWLARYLAGEIDGASVTNFEAYALTKNHLLDAIEADTALRALMPLARGLRPHQTVTA